MSELLSRYQIAVLQEMGITVWETRSASSPATSQPPAEPKSVPLSSPSSRSEKLAQLRSTIVSASSEEERSEPKLLQQLPKHHPLVKDILQALSNLVLTTDEQNFRCYLSNTLEVTQNRVLLPVVPEQLQPAQKKALWEAMCKLSSSHAH